VYGGGGGILKIKDIGQMKGQIKDIGQMKGQIKDIGQMKGQIFQGYEI
jgi:hypothetical protein